MTATAASTAKAATRQRSPGAIRMSWMRERRQRGFRCYSIEVCEADIDALVARGFLDRLRRKDPGAIERAIGAVLDRI
jgi:RecB family exonuclease